MYNYYSNVQKRKVFISYYHGDQEAVNKFVRDFGDVFIPKTPLELRMGILILIAMILST